MVYFRVFDMLLICSLGLFYGMIGMAVLKTRWYTYLNTECKKGGWSAEEDMILCEV